MTPAAGPGSAWERGTARVLHEGRPVGVAFLIPDRLLLTCAHVVASTAGLPEGEPLPELLPVTLDFPLLPGRPESAATVHFSVPVAGDNSGDVAVLQLTGEAPPGAVPLRIVEADDLAGHRWRAFGFPRYPGRGGSKDAGIWTRGTVEGREGTGQAHGVGQTDRRRCEERDEDRVHPGRHRVVIRVALVVQRVPARVLLEVCPAIRPVEGEQHALASATHGPGETHWPFEGRCSREWMSVPGKPVSPTRSPSDGHRRSARRRRPVCTDCCPARCCPGRRRSARPRPGGPHARPPVARQR